MATEKQIRFAEQLVGKIAAKYPSIGDVLGQIDPVQLLDTLSNGGEFLIRSGKFGGKEIAIVARFATESADLATVADSVMVYAVGDGKEQFVPDNQVESVLAKVGA